MQGLATKVQRGVYDKIPPHFTADLNQMIKSCLQVTPSNRPSCEKILATPGLLNHMTGTLEDLDYDEDLNSDNQGLLQTIRCPRNLGQITERLPAPQYQPKMKRCNSMAIDTSKACKLGIDKENQETQNQVIKLKSDLKELTVKPPV